MLYIFLVTPTLGLLRNYIKYKKLKVFLYLRSPILYLLLEIILQTNNIWKILIVERWLMLILKSLISLYKNDYYNKKEKYIQKYNLKY